MFLTGSCSLCSTTFPLHTVQPCCTLLSDFPEQERSFGYKCSNSTSARLLEFQMESYFSEFIY